MWYVIDYCTDNLRKTGHTPINTQQIQASPEKLMWYTASLTAVKGTLHELSLPVGRSRTPTGLLVEIWTRLNATLDQLGWDSG